ncbi:MAG: hypothetical protein AVDCRST_MAG13-2575 [uncultured Solirubrobacteraceae bacterium]|uniref:Uncharacterized protein n=1 Tax=uncultured Solirubrobacteraceae bacterium TaxID=1162706 RepID=A0A6J4SVV9_9ACTN|nr:MAG: hypothetical protein AVDCRST_MAG13-2575 [uncultured Solirubrobacteraceae bacterium]
MHPQPSPPNTVFEAYRDPSGAALVKLWQSGGTRALDPAALRLLSASE